jgi:hypothetical protein
VVKSGHDRGKREGSDTSDEPVSANGAPVKSSTASMPGRVPCCTEDCFPAVVVVTVFFDSTARPWVSWVLQGGEEALKYAFNYNTVEAALLFAAIIICLLGIIFASEYAAPGSALYNTFGSITVAVIATSLVYYFIVVWSEIIAVIFPSLAFSFLSGNIEGKRDRQVRDPRDGGGLASRRV